MNVVAVGAAEPLIEVARATLRDLHQGDAPSLSLSMRSTLEHDLGLDSLARVEFFARIEQDLGVQLPDSLFETAETLGDIADAMTAAQSLRADALQPSVERASPISLAAAPPSNLVTLTEVLRWHRDNHPSFPHLTVCSNGREDTISYEQLWNDACRIAGSLQDRGLRHGDTVALMLPTGADYFGAFFGILLAGAVPVPLYPPTRLSQVEEHVRRHAGILTNAMADTLITTADMHRLAAVLRGHVPTLHGIVTADELRSSHTQPRLADVHADSIALLQYTSGSTGQPKGVVLTHANVLSNIAALGTALAIRRDDVFVSWLPLYHDMGLIGAWLGTLYFGLPLVVMSPLAFLSRPLRWLDAISRHRGTLAAAPNFAYELCLKRVTDNDLSKLDLSTWRIAMNGAEAVMPETLARFQSRFTSCGLRHSALTPVYGLAECSVGLTVPPLDRGPLIDVIDRESFARQGIATPARPDANSLSFVSCGKPLARHDVRVVDDDGKPVEERHEGRLEFRGPSATQGYYRNPDATARLLRDGWLDSGDRAYMAAGEVYITGRIKDIIIRAGQHIYPDELEAAIGTVPGVRTGCVAVFGSTDGTTGTERLVVLAETHLKKPEPRETLRHSINSAVVALLGDPPDRVVLAAPHTVLKTSSGKIRRAASREVYESRKYAFVEPRASSSQLLRLALSSAPAISRRAVHRLSELMYGGYFWTIFGVLGSVLFMLAMLPLPARAIWATSHRAARTCLLVTGIRLAVHGVSLEHATAGAVIVANHSSYLDGLVLMAALPKSCRFVVKRELMRVPIVGPFLQRLNVIFVERFDVRAGVEDAHHLAKLVSRGERCVVFPEGTFVRAPGLLAFHLGAFAAAVEADRPVVPVTLRGTRALLPDGTWLPRRGPIDVHVGAPLAPPQAVKTFSATVELRDAARRHILEYCGEGDSISLLPATAANSLPTNSEHAQLR